MKSVGLRAAIGLAALAASAVLAAWGDQVVLKDGTELECKVTGYDNGLFFISAQDIATNIPSAKVAKIRFAPGSDRAGQPGRGGAADESRKKLDLNELEWVKTALAQPKVQESNPKSIMANRVDLAGQLVKIEFPYRAEMRQQTDKVYTAIIGEMGNHMRASFGKDGVAFMNKIPEMKEGKAMNTFSAYGVVLSDQMKRDLFHDPYQVGDILLLGRVAKKSAAGKITYSW